MIETSELVFQDENNNVVVILEDVIKVMLGYRQLTFNSLEAAGVLIGERRGSHLVICDLSLPGTGDLRSRYRVDRRGKHHQEKVNGCFRTSEGYLQYLGEWHTHPEDFPEPSPLDKKSWKDNLIADFPMVTVIIGRKALWIARKEGDKLQVLRETSSSEIFSNKNKI